MIEACCVDNSLVRKSCATPFIISSKRATFYASRPPRAISPPPKFNHQLEAFLQVSTWPLSSLQPLYKGSQGNRPFTAFGGRLRAGGG